MKRNRQKTIFKSLIILATIFFYNACNSALNPKAPEPLKQAAHIESQPEIIPEPEEEIPPDILEKKVPSSPKPRPFVHKVRWQGEMLTYISRWYTGTVNNWRAIANANPKLNPNRIFIGDEIIIPEELVKTRTPLPRDYLPSSQEIKTSPSPTSQSKDESGDIELFGPVGIDQKPLESTKINELKPLK